MSADSIRRGYLLAALTVAIWAGFILVSRAGGASVFNGFDIAALRFATAAAILLPLWRGERRVPLFEPRMIALAATGGFGYSMLAYSGFQFAPAAHAAILLPGMLPFETAVIAWLVLGEKPHAARLAGLACIACGVGALAVESFSGGLGRTWIGDLLFVCASTSWATYTVIARRWGTRPLDAAIGVTLVSAALYLPVYVLLLPKQLLAAPPGAIIMQALYQGVLVTVVAMLLFMKAMTLIGPTRLSTFMALVPALAGLSAVPVLGEPLSVWLVLGLLMVSLGALLGSRTRLPFTRRPGD